MQPLKAHVRNQRLVLDEPTDLPEGTVIELVPLDDVLASGGDALDDEEQAALNREREASFAEEVAGLLVDLPRGGHHMTVDRSWPLSEARKGSIAWLPSSACARIWWTQRGSSRP